MVSLVTVFRVISNQQLPYNVDADRIVACPFAVGQSVSNNGEVSQACNVTDRQTDTLQKCTVLCGAAVLSLAEAFVLGEGRKKKD